MNSTNSRQSAVLEAVDKLVQLARDLNRQRSPDHRERISAAVASVSEYFRDGVEAELPSSQASPLLAQVLALAGASDASPEGYARAIDALAAVVGDTRSAAQRTRTKERSEA